MEPILINLCVLVFILLPMLKRPGSELKPLLLFPVCERMSSYLMAQYRLFSAMKR